MPWSPSYEQFFFDSMKFFVNFFSPKMHFLNFRMNHTFLGVAFNAPFDLSWGSRRLISFTYQKRCFMTIFRFRFFFSPVRRIFVDFSKERLVVLVCAPLGFAKVMFFWFLNIKLIKSASKLIKLLQNSLILKVSALETVTNESGVKNPI